MVKTIAEMAPLRTLLLASGLAPLATGEHAEVVAHLARALARAGERLIVALRRPADLPDAELDRLGLARRLDPLSLATPHGRVTLTLREGRLAGGEVPVFTFEGPGAERDDVVAAAALELCARRHLWPHLVRAFHDAPRLLSLARLYPAPSGHETPASVLLLGESRALTPPLRDAISAADRVVLPSATYADQLLERGEGDLVDVLRGLPDRVRGIPPGADESRWNPARDPHLGGSMPATPAGKRALKRALRHELGMAGGGLPLVVALGPVDLLDGDAAEAVALSDCQILFAEPEAPTASARAGEELVRGLARRHPLRVRCVHAGAPLLHRMVAAADVVLYCHADPTGAFSPLAPMLYGAVPVVPRAGAFGDAVVDWDARSATGSGFLYPPHRPEEIATALRRALRAAAHPEGWQRLVDQVRSTDLSWHTAGVRHADLGREALRAARALSAPAA